MLRWASRSPWFFLAMLGQFGPGKSHDSPPRMAFWTLGVPEPYEILVQRSKRQTRPTQSWSAETRTLGPHRSVTNRANSA